MTEQPPVEPSSDREAKDRFREALERKRAQQHAHNDAGPDSSKIAGEHARVGGKRAFRRKSG